MFYKKITQKIFSKNENFELCFGFFFVFFNKFMLSECSLAMSCYFYTSKYPEKTATATPRGIYSERTRPNPNLNRICNGIIFLRRLPVFYLIFFSKVSHAENHLSLSCLVLPVEITMGQPKKRTSAKFFGLTLSVRVVCLK
jgi:hypothetical protein